MNLITQDLNLIIELTDILQYSSEKLPLLRSKITPEQQKLINELSIAVNNYRSSSSKEGVISI